MSDTGFRAQARWQADWCARLGSPFTAQLCTLLADRLPPESALGRALDGWAGDAFADVLALRVTGGLHALVRAGGVPALARLYPPAPLPDADRLWDALAPVLADPALQAFIDRAPQTNEVGRSGVLVPGFLAAVAHAGLPLRLFELGASAGLNLVADRYRIEAGGVVAGDPLSPLVIRPDWKGPPPPDVPLRISGRMAVDLHPLDVADPAIADRMLAYIWPDQQKRLARMAAAIALAAADPPRLVAGDAADFVETEVTLQPGSMALVFHSIAFQYFPPRTQQRIAARLEALGAAAGATAPLGWLRFETEDAHGSAPPTLRLRIWPGGEDRLLARAHPHGEQVHWLG